MTQSALQQSPVAIIGQSAIFAQAANLSEYWDNIIHKADCITEIPPSRWEIEDYYDPDPEKPDKTYCKRGGFVPEIDFDPLEFGLPPTLLDVTDTSQLLGLIAARDAMEDAGYGLEKDFDRLRTGVILGVAGGQKLITDLSARLQYPVWKRVLESSGINSQDAEIIIEKIKLAYAPWNENSFPGLLGNVIAGRIANRLDLGGLNSVVDAACASSLAAVRMAVSELVAGRAEMMITGGVDTDNSPFTYLCFSKTPAFSPSQKIRPFDQDSDGMLIGEGLGMLVLKRLADAERDGDRIYAVIRGIGSSSDGKYKSIYAPRPSGQSLAIERAYQEAGLDPTDIQLVEAHGTGTKAGDPAEFAGLNAVFGNPNGKAQTIALGSVKSQIGHTKAAAGAAGLIKTALGLHQKVLPPTINVTKPAEGLEIDQSYFYLNSESRPWFRSAKGSTRKAAVSAFGFGGTNFHLVVEEYPESDQGAYRLGSVPRTYIFSAESTSDLEQKLTTFRSELSSADPDQNPAAWKSIETNPPEDQNQVRLGFLASNNNQLRNQLDRSLKTIESQPESNSWDHPKGIFFRSEGISPGDKIAAIFPGQGSQYLNMLVRAVTNFPPLRQAFESMDQIFHANGQNLLSDIVYPIPSFDPQTEKEQEGQLQETDYAQAGIGVVSYGLFSLLKQAGFQPDFTAGHSFGELTALWAGEAINDESFFRLVKARGEAMQPSQDTNNDPGKMAAVKGDYHQIQSKIEDLDEVVIANQNSPQQIVLAGPTDSIKQAETRLSEDGIKVTILPVSAAFHTELVSHATKPFQKAVLEEKFHQPSVPVYSNTTGEPYPDEIDQSKEILANHILHPVIFQTQIEKIYANGGRVFVEIGPRQILGNLVSEILDGRPHEVISVNPSREKDSDFQLREAVVKLQVLGVDLSNFDPYQRNYSLVNKLQPAQEML